MFPKMDEERFRRVLDTHLVGSYHCSQAALDYLPDDGTGRIINVTSAAGLVGTIGQANYGAAKAAIIGLTKSLAKELAKRNDHRQRGRPARRHRDDREHPQQREARREDAGADPARDAGPIPTRSRRRSSSSPRDAAAYITGQVLPVDGGTVI